MSNDQRNINIEDFPAENNLKDKIFFVLQYAVLAPSTHNTQPWLFKVKESSCEVFYDKNLLLPEADKKMRDLYISIGCALENLILAAMYFDIFESIDYGPFDDKEKIATVLFKQYSGKTNNGYKKLVDTILVRRNARGMFAPVLVPEKLLEDIYFNVNDYLVDGINIKWLKEKNKINDIAFLTSEGLEIAYSNPSFRKEMSKWMNHSLTSKKEGIPGYALKMPILLSFILPTLVRFFNIGKFLGKKNYQSLSSAPLVVVITATKEDYITWVKIGRLAERLFLEFNSSNWQTSIFVASIEMSDLYKKVQKIINIEQVPQFLFVVGKVDSLHKLTPRYELSKKIIN